MQIYFISTQFIKIFLHLFFELKLSISQYIIKSVLSCLAFTGNNLQVNLLALLINCVLFQSGLLYVFIQMSIPKMFKTDQNLNTQDVCVDPPSPWMVVDSITDIRKSSIARETGKLYQNFAFPGLDLEWNEPWFYGS